MENPQWPVAALVAVVLFGVIAAAIVRTGTPAGAERQGPSVQEIGTSLFTQWAIPFEVASVLLLVALIGAIVIARVGDKD